MAKNKTLCATPRCTRTKAKGSRFCHTCNKRKFVKAHPLESAYYDLRTNVARRNRQKLAKGQPTIGWNLSLEDFRQFCYKTDILHGRGRTKESYHIDRIREDDPRGYHIDNIQKLTCSENVQKENNRRKVICYDYLTKTGYMLEVKPVQEIEGVPF